MEQATIDVRNRVEQLKDQLRSQCDRSGQIQHLLDEDSERLEQIGEAIDAQRVRLDAILATIAAA